MTHLPKSNRRENAPLFRRVQSRGEEHKNGPRRLKRGPDLNRNLQIF